MTTASTSRVVVGVDGSPISEQALRWGAFIADRSQATLEAVIAWPTPLEASVAWAPVGLDWDPEGDARASLDASLERVFGDAVPATLTRGAVWGGAAKVLLAASEGARMLVLGSRGHGGFSGLLLGSVSTACTEHATCPVLVIHGNTPPPS